MKVERCKSCGESVIFMVNNKTGKMSPYNADTIAFNYDVSLGYDSTLGHVNHFVTCPQREMWSKKKKVEGTIQKGLFD